MKIIVRHEQKPEVKDYLVGKFGGYDHWSAEAVRIVDGLYHGHDSWWAYQSSGYVSDGYTLIDATTEEGFEQLKRAVEGTPEPEPDMATNKRDRSPDKPTKGNCFIVGLNTNTSKEVQDILFEAGHGWLNGSIKRHENLRYGSLVSGKKGPSDTTTQIRVGDGADPKPGWPVFDANTEMEDIYRFFGVKFKQKTLDQVVSAYLINLIRSVPKDEMVAGFIRRDLGIALPKEVQEAGTDSILNWIAQEKKCLPINEEPPKIEKKFVIDLDYEETVYLSRRLSRPDIVYFKVEVPEEVMRHALDEDDYGIISDWIEENRERWRDVDRGEGEEEVLGEETTDSDYGGISTYSPIQEAFNKFKQQQ